ncbi:MAG: hypothetical protein NTW19_07080 [Planctomycetota bacterium]|nr:hypothetical protein [Planctomycetota bacterium]
MFLSRRALLRLMMICIAMIAVAGVAGVVFGTWDLVWRLMASCFAGAVAAGLMLRASGWIDQPAKRRAGIWAMWLAIVQFGIAVVAICLSGWGSGYDLGGRLWLTLLEVAVAGWWSVRFVLMLEQPIARRAGLVGLGVDAVAFALAMGATWIAWGSSGWWLGTTGEKLIGSSITVGLDGLVVCGCLVGWVAGDRRHWRWLGVAAATVSAVGFIIGIWLNKGGDPTPLGVISSLGLFVAFTNLILFAPLRGGQNVLRLLTIAAAGVTLGLVDIMALMKIDNFDTLPMRLSIASGILAVCGTLAIIVLARLNRGVPEARVVGDPAVEGKEIQVPRELALTCPLCQKKQTLPAGDAACSGCGLRFVIKLELPRCAACGYLLLHHKGETCPECGGRAGVAEPVAKEPGL